METEYIILNHIRYEFGSNYTLGVLFLNNKRYCYVLEDAMRHPEVKVMHETCIPAGLYQATIQRSPRFRKDLITLSNYSALAGSEGFISKNHNVGFTGIRVHGGNDSEDTSGCPLVAYNLGRKPGTIYGSASTDLRNQVQKFLSANKTILWAISVVPDFKPLGLKAPDFEFPTQV